VKREKLIEAINFFISADSVVSTVNSYKRLKKILTYSDIRDIMFKY